MPLNKRKHIRNTSVNPMRNSPMHNIASHDAAYDFMEIFFKKRHRIRYKEIKRRSK